MPADIETTAEQVFTALADPSLRAILAALAAAGPATATDLAGRLPITRQAIAKHLALLAEAGLVTAEPGERRRVRYRLHSAPMQVAQQFLAALARDWDSPLSALQDHLTRVLEGPAQPHYKEREDVMTELTMPTPPVVTAGEWEAARQQLLVKEKEVSRARDALAAQRRRMPWLLVENDYAFDGPDGLEPARPVRGPPSADRLPRVLRARRVRLAGPRVHRLLPGRRSGRDVAHLNARDTTLAFVSPAPQPDIARVKARMGWTHPWYTMTDGFAADFGVADWHGTNAFIRDGDRVFRTYFLNNRGDEPMGGTWAYLDITALGRQEEWEDSPEGYPQVPPYSWWNWHDEYGAAQAPPGEPGEPGSEHGSAGRAAGTVDHRHLVCSIIAGSCPAQRPAR